MRSPRREQRVSSAALSPAARCHQPPCAARCANAPARPQALLPPAACLLLLAASIPAAPAAARPLQQPSAAPAGRPAFNEISFEGSALLITYYSGVARS
jgi:hypothetical protein